jgi:hypothetical protein
MQKVEAATRKSPFNIMPAPEERFTAGGRLVQPGVDNVSKTPRLHKIVLYKFL